MGKYDIWEDNKVLLSLKSKQAKDAMPCPLISICSIVKVFLRADASCNESLKNKWTSSLTPLESNFWRKMGWLDLASTVFLTR